MHPYLQFFRNSFKYHGKGESVLCSRRTGNSTPDLIETDQRLEKMVVQIGVEAVVAIKRWHGYETEINVFRVVHALSKAPLGLSRLDNNQRPSV